MVELVNPLDTPCISIIVQTREKLVLRSNQVLMWDERSAVCTSTDIAMLRARRAVP